MSWKRIVPPLLSVALAACTLSLDGPPPAHGPEPGPEPAPAAPVDPAALMAEARIPGLAWAVLADGEIARVGFAGVADAYDSEPVTGETLFEAASLSKPVFATAVLRLAERGEIDLDRPLHQILPYDRISHDPRSELLTARLVLSHRTGLPNWGPERLDFTFDPGARFGYSGEGFVYLQRCVEALTGEALDAFVRREVFAPLGLRRSRFSWPEDEEPPLALPHDEAGRRQDKRIPNEGNAAASLHTTAGEYARFVAAWMNGDLLSPETVAEALEPQVRMTGEESASPRRAAVAQRIAWGLGWGLVLPPQGGSSSPVAWHWGDNGPAKAFVAFDPGAKRGLVYFANSTNGLAIGRELVRNALGNLDVAFEWAGYDPYDRPGWAERLDGLVAEREGRLEDALAAFERARNLDPDDEEVGRRADWLAEIVERKKDPVDLPARLLESYAGDYGPRHLRVEDGRLVYQRDGGRVYPLTPLTETVFLLDGLSGFRLEVVLAGEDRPVKLVGHYVEGHVDESLRDP